jgi:hypothetical protein
MPSLLQTRSVRMEHVLIVSFQAPVEDVDRIMGEVTRITPLAMGAYDGNAFQSAPGIERYRPREGAAAGAESEPRRRPGVVEVSFQLPDDRALLAEVIEAVFQVHSYQEPVIAVREALVSRSKGLDDRDNPHRWWNTTGDWRKSAPAP